MKFRDCDHSNHPETKYPCSRWPSFMHGSILYYINQDFSFDPVIYMISGDGLPDRVAAVEGIDPSKVNTLGVSEDVIFAAMKFNKGYAGLSLADYLNEIFADEI